MTTLDDSISRFIEVNSPSVSSRLNALEVLHKNLINSYAFIGPIMPHALNHPDKFNQLFDRLEEVGVKKIWLEHLNLSSKIRDRLFGYLSTHNPELIPAFTAADTQGYRQELEKMISACLKGRNFEIGLGQVIYHHKLPKS